MKAEVFIGFACIVILGGFFLGFSGSVDDAYITYWSADILADKGEILNYNLDRVEQSSALLQVIVLALLHWVSGISVPVLGHVITIAAALSTIVVLVRLSASIEAGLAWPAVLLLSTSPFFVYWSYGGMEGPLLALLLLIMIQEWQLFLQKSSGVVLVLISTLCAQLARPEMLLVCCATSVLLGVIFWLRPVCCWNWNARRMLCLVVIQFVLAAGILVFRQRYFGDYWPQPVSAKASGSLLANIQLGFDYVRDVVANPACWLAVFMALGSVAWLVTHWGKTIPPIMLLVVTMAVIYSGFVVTSGGDWMAAGRFWVPVVPLYALITAYGLVRIVLRRGSRWFVIAALLLCNVVYLWRGVSIDFNGFPLWTATRLLPQDQPERYSFFERHGREHLHDMPTLAFMRPLVAQILDIRKGRPLNIMAGQAGMVLFYLGREFPGQLRVIDRNGLTDRIFTGCPVAAGLPRTRNGLGNGYEWVVQQREALARQCQFEMPDVVFDIETSWNKRNTDALRALGYVLIYQQRGHILEDGVLLPARRIGAGQYVAVSGALYAALGYPALVRRIFDEGLEK